MLGVKGDNTPEALSTVLSTYIVIARNVVSGLVIRGQIQVLWDLKLMKFGGLSLRKRKQSYKYKIRHINANEGPEDYSSLTPW